MRHAARTPHPSKNSSAGVAFFSLDTDVIQAAGYNPGRGARSISFAPTPTTMKLQLTEVVLRKSLATGWYL